MMVDPLSIHGVVRDSPYSQLFLEIYHLTKPKSTDEDHVMNETLSRIQGVGLNLNNFEDVSDPKDMEEGEIREFDSPEHSLVEADPACPVPSMENGNQGNPFKVPLPPSELRKFKKKQKVNLKKMMKNPKQIPGSMDLSNKLPTSKRMKSILVRRSSEKPPLNKFQTDLQSQFDLDTSPVRLEWLQCYLTFMENRGTPVKQSPTVPLSHQQSCILGSTSRPALDLYKLFQVVNFGQLSGTGHLDWNNVALKMNVPQEKSKILKRIYQQYLLDYEMDQKVNNNFHHEEFLERKVLLPTPVSSSTSRPSSTVNKFSEALPKRLLAMATPQSSSSSSSPVSAKSSVFDYVAVPVTKKRFRFAAQKNIDPSNNSMGFSTASAFVNQSSSHDHDAFDSRKIYSTASDNEHSSLPSTDVTSCDDAFARVTREMEDVSENFPQSKQKLTSMIPDPVPLTWNNNRVTSKSKFKGSVFNRLGGYQS